MKAGSVPARGTAARTRRPTSPITTSSPRRSRSSTRSSATRRTRPAGGDSMSRLPRGRRTTSPTGSRNTAFRGKTSRCSTLGAGTAVLLFRNPNRGHPWNPGVARAERHVHPRRLLVQGLPGQPANLTAAPDRSGDRHEPRADPERPARNAEHVVGDDVRFPYTAVGMRYDLNHGKWHGPNSGNFD